MNIALGQTLTWDSVPSATLYDVELQNEALNSVLGFFTVSTPFITADDLLVNRAAGNYNVRIRAKNATLTGAYSGFVLLEYSGLAVPSNIHVV